MRSAHATTTRGGFTDEHCNLVSGDGSPGTCRDGAVLPVHGRVREDLTDEVMKMLIYVTAAVAAFLFVYLVVALVRPERF